MKIFKRSDSPTEKKVFTAYMCEWSRFIYFGVQRLRQQAIVWSIQRKISSGFRAELKVSTTRQSTCSRNSIIHLESSVHGEFNHWRNWCAEVNVTECSLFFPSRLQIVVNKIKWRRAREGGTNLEFWFSFY